MEGLEKVRRVGGLFADALGGLTQAVEESRRKTKRRNAHYYQLTAINPDFVTEGYINYTIFAPARGTGVNDRTSKKVRLKSLQMRGAIWGPTSGVGGVIPPTYNHCTIYIVYDRDPRASVPAMTDILEYFSEPSYAYNRDRNADRFEIIRRLEYNLTGNDFSVYTTAAGTEFLPNHAACVARINEYIPLNDRIVEFDGPLGTDVSYGNLIFVCCGNHSQLSFKQAHCHIEGPRIRFYDATE